MGLSRELIEEHIASWSGRLAATNWPYRQFWPRRLFRHEPLQNAARILRSGHLLSRRDVESRTLEHLDIAAPSVIGTREDAYDFVRLYFRPRNPTQYRVEGVRRPEECVDGDMMRQAAMLVMLVFNFLDILTSDGVWFSNGNMQATAGRTQLGDSEDFFRSIDFERVYHEGAYDSQSTAGRDITRSRNAEVLVPSPLPLGSCLRAVVCRTPSERATLLHALGDQAPRWSDRVVLWPMPGLFFLEKAFVESVEADSQGFTITFHPRRDSRTVRVRVAVKASNGTVVFQSSPQDLDLSNRWRWRCNFSPGHYLCSIELDGSLAHEAPFLIDDSPF